MLNKFRCGQSRARNATRRRQEIGWLKQYNRHHLRSVRIDAPTDKEALIDAIDNAKRNVDLIAEECPVCRKEKDLAL